MLAVVVHKCCTSAMLLERAARERADKVLKGTVVEDRATSVSEGKASKCPFLHRNRGGGRHATGIETA